MTNSELHPGSVVDEPRLWLRLEGGLALIVSLALYQRAELSWWLFAGCLLAPDVSTVGYLAGPRFGARIYNITHSYVAPALVAATCLLLQWPMAPLLIWTAHIGLDRLLGFGLKYPTGFGDTHLGSAGGRRRN
jgi:hypothetical protein